MSRLWVQAGLSYCKMPRPQLKDGLLITKQAPYFKSLSLFLSSTLLLSSSTFKNPCDYIYTPNKDIISTLMSLCLIPSPEFLSSNTMTHPDITPRSSLGWEWGNYTVHHVICNIIKEGNYFSRVDTQLLGKNVKITWLQTLRHGDLFYFYLFANLRNEDENFRKEVGCIYIISVNFFQKSLGKMNYF